jgi:diguanylate cyclase (GGDEF)-like protein
LLFIDLDKFKAVNDTLGHAAGDQLLCIAAERMRTCLRDIDTLARLGGDEFAAIIRDTANPLDVAHVAHRLIAAVSQPYDLSGEIATIGASVGVAIAPVDGDTADVLQLRADFALYAAKDAGRGGVKFFDAELGTAAEAADPLRRSRDIAGPILAEPAAASPG